MLNLAWGVSFEAYLEGLTLGGVQAEFVVISPLVKFIKNHLHTTWLGNEQFSASVKSSTYFQHFI